jgi:hypothetical protein
MREWRPYGFVRGAVSNVRPYRDPCRQSVPPSPCRPADGREFWD